MTLRITSSGLIFIIGLLFVFPREAVSCPIPVYRYALEFWEPDPYRVTIYTQGPLSDSQKQIHDLLVENAVGQTALSNVDITHVDLETNPQAPARRHSDISSLPDTPWIVLQYPQISAKNETVWNGPLTMDNAEQLLNSPARDKLAKHLARGEMVWLFIESENRSKNREAFSILERELNRLEQTLVLPDPEQWWTNREGVDQPEIKFKIITVSKDDPSEKQLIDMLLHSEEDLLEFDSEPMIFPVYGRGIALWAIVGSGINSWNITDAAEFLTGPCSCQIKMLNPGIDLLISKNWDDSVEMISDAMLTPITGFTEFEERGEEMRKRLEEQGVLPERDKDDTRTGSPSAADVPAAPGAETDTESEAHQYEDVFEEQPLADVTSVPIDSEAREAAGNSFSMRVLTIIFGIMVLVVFTGFVLFKYAGNEKGSMQ